MQAADMGSLQRVHGVTLREKVRSCEIRRTLKVEPFLHRIVRSQRWFKHVSRIPHESLRSKSCWLNPRESGPEENKYIKNTNEFMKIKEYK